MAVQIPSGFVLIGDMGMIIATSFSYINEIREDFFHNSSLEAE